MNLPVRPLTLIALASTLLFFSCQKDTPDVDPPPPSVDAGPAQTITLPVDSAWLSGTAIDHNSRIVAYLWSEVSGPNVPEISTEGSKTTWIKGLVAGTNVYQLEVTDSLGLTGVDTLSITVNAPGNHINGLVPVRMDGFLSGTTTVYAPFGTPNSIEYLASAWTINGNPVTGRTLFAFDFSQLKTPPAQVQKAILKLYSDRAPINGDFIHANAGTTNDFWIERTVAQWDPSTTQWPNLPATDTTGRVHVPQTDSAFLDLSLDVTTMVNAMLTGPNYGFTMRLNTEQYYNGRIFCSENAADSTKWPRLVLTY